MRCPRDDHQLNRKVSERVFGDCCNQCDGIFLSGKGIQAYEHDIEKQLRENTFQQQSTGDSDLMCPHCNSEMNVTHVDEIEIDICQHCKGVWFDRTEAQAILHKFGQETSSDSSITFAPFPSEFVHLISKWFMQKPQLENS